MRAICLALVTLSGLWLPSFATPLEDRASSLCQKRDRQSLQDCYIKLLKTFKGHPRELVHMAPQDAAAFCDLVAGENDSRFCGRFGGPANKSWSTRLEATFTAFPHMRDPWEPILEPSSDMMADSH
jgi:hypothetical protein